MLSIISFLLLVLFLLLVEILLIEKDLLGKMVWHRLTSSSLTLSARARFITVELLILGDLSRIQVFQHNGVIV